MATDDQIQVAMKHEETGGIAVVAKSSFRVTWRKNGWRLVSEEDGLEDLLKAADLLGKDVEVLGDDPSAEEVYALISPSEEEVVASSDTSPTRPRGFVSDDNGGGE